MANSVCLSVCVSEIPEIPRARVTFAIHGHITPYWNQDVPRIENRSFRFGAKGPISLPQESLCHKNLRPYGMQ